MRTPRPKRGVKSLDRLHFQLSHDFHFMFGKLLSSAIKVVTLPVDAASAAADLVTGGNGSKRSRTKSGDVFPNIIGAAEELRDRVAEAAEDIDD